MAVSVRYLVDDVGTVSAFYVSLLGFREVGDWVAQYRSHWEQSFDRLAEYLGELRNAEETDDSGKQ